MDSPLVLFRADVGKGNYTITRAYIFISDQTCPHKPFSLFALRFLGGRIRLHLFLVIGSAAICCNLTPLHWFVVFTASDICVGTILVCRWFPSSTRPQRRYWETWRATLSPVTASTSTSTRFFQHMCAHLFLWLFQSS